jgi:hypothetical protein
MLVASEALILCSGCPTGNERWLARHVGVSAIGQCLKDQYDALATPIPPHLAALVKQLETQER